jgi:hypothetical protein
MDHQQHTVADGDTDQIVKPDKDIVHQYIVQEHPMIGAEAEHYRE